MGGSQANNREIILGILLEVAEHGAYSHIAIRNALEKYQFLEKQERSFITRVCQGTLERMITIDYMREDASYGTLYLEEQRIRVEVYGCYPGCCNL